MINSDDIYSKLELDLISRDLKDSRYEIEYGDIKGTLKVWAIPIKTYLLDKDSIPPKIIIFWSQLSTFLNKGKKGVIDLSPVSPDLLQRSSEVNLVGTEYVNDVYEPYSEFTFRIENTFYTVKAKTVINRLEPAGRNNSFGDPVLLLQFNTSIGISKSNSTIER